MRTNVDCVLYYGVAITERAHRERKLSSYNVAGTNRMIRLAQALQRPGRKCFVISPGIFPRMKTSWRVMPGIVERKSNILFFTLAQLGVCWVGFLLSPVSAILAARRIARQHRITQVVHYNFTPDGILLSFWCWLRYRSKIVVDLEDINLPRWSDFSTWKKSAPFHQLAYWLARKIAVSFSHAVIVPTKHFRIVVPDSKKMVVITGCQLVTCHDEMRRVDNDDVVRLLHSGGTKPDYGAEILAKALQIVDRMEPSSHLEIFVCGKDINDWFKNQTLSLTKVKVYNLGFLSADEFQHLLCRMDGCFALQDPLGRQGAYQTPSKGYEALCLGKALIVSDVGDFNLIPEDVCFHLSEYTPEALAVLLAGLTKTSVEMKRFAGHKYAAENFDLAVIRNRLLEEGL